MRVLTEFTPLLVVSEPSNPEANNQDSNTSLRGTTNTTEARSYGLHPKT